MGTPGSSLHSVARRLPFLFAAITVMALPALYAAGQWMTARLTERTLALWMERGQRVPKWVWKSPERASTVSSQGRDVTRRSAAASTLQLYPLPVESAVTQVASTPQGWVAVTFDDGAFVLRDGVARLLPLGNRVNEVHAHQGALWAATDQGLWELRGEEAPQRQAEGAFTSLASWRNSLWTLSRSGVARVDTSGLTRWGQSFGFDADSPSVLRVCGEALCACASNGVFVFDGTTFTRRSTAGSKLPNDFATDITSDGSQTWVGTFDAGLAQWSQGSVVLWTSHSGLPDGRVQPRTLVTSSSGVVFGTPSGLFSVRGGEVLEWTFQGSPLGAVSAVTRAPDGSLFIGLAGRVVQVELGKESRI